MSSGDWLRKLRLRDRWWGLGRLCVLGLGGRWWLPVVAWAEWLPVVACGCAVLSGCLWLQNSELAWLRYRF